MIYKDSIKIKYALYNSEDRQRFKVVYLKVKPSAGEILDLGDKLYEVDNIVHTYRDHMQNHVIHLFVSEI